MMIRIESEKLEKWISVVKYLKSTSDQSLGWQRADETVHEMRVELEVARREQASSSQTTTEQAIGTN